MACKDWVSYLPDGFQLLARVVSQQGKIKKFAVVLMHMNEVIARYDNAGELQHRDVLGAKKGFMRKKWHDYMTNEEFVEYAIEDLAENYERHLAYYRSH